MISRASQKPPRSPRSPSSSGRLLLCRACAPASGREPVAAKIRKVAIDGAYESASTGLFNWIAVMHTQTAHTFQGAGMLRVWTRTRLSAGRRGECRPTRVHPRAGGHAATRVLALSKFNRLAHAPSEVYPFAETALDAIALGNAQEGHLSR